MRTLLVYAGLVFGLLIPASGGAEVQKGRAGRTRPAADWHNSWDLYLKTVQRCLDAERKNPKNECSFGRFKGQTINWEGTFRGVRQTEKVGEVVDVEMTPGTMTDPNGTSAKVANLLYLHPADLAAWRTLTVGDRVRFRARISSGILGGAFMPTNESGCCFIVALDGKAVLLSPSGSQQK